MTVQELTTQFSDRLRRADSQSAVNGTHTAPCYPMMVLTLGGRTRRLTATVAAVLRRYRLYRHGTRPAWPRVHEPRTPYGRTAPDWP